MLDAGSVSLELCRLEFPDRELEAGVGRIEQAAEPPLKRRMSDAFMRSCP
jgi:hypothetical protein